MADIGTPVGELTKRFAKSADKANSTRSENRAEMMTDKAKQRAQNGAATDQESNDVFHGRKGKRAATY